MTKPCGLGSQLKQLARLDVTGEAEGLRQGQSVMASISVCAADADPHTGLLMHLKHGGFARLFRGFEGSPGQQPLGGIIGSFLQEETGAGAMAVPHPSLVWVRLAWVYGPGFAPLSWPCLATRVSTDQ